MITILTTGFGAFPGVKDNPSATLMDALAARRAHFARFGIQLKTNVLPVAYNGLKPRVATLVKDIAPQGILHFGVAVSRTVVSIELYARNRVSLHTADVNGACPRSLRLDAHAADKVAVRIPAAQIAAKIAQAGIAVELSQNAGTYLCNALLLETLTSHRNLAAGFIHIPTPRSSRTLSSRPSFAEIVQAADIALIAIAARVRQTSRLSATSSAS